jgi:glutathione S-transferase
MSNVLVQNGDALSENNVHQLILYDAPASPCARRCRITMLEKRLVWDTVNINLALMEQRHPDYLSINPNGFVPTLMHGDFAIIESGVINTYLEDQFPELRLMPVSAVGIAAVRKWQASELAMAKIFRPLMYALNGGPIKHITRTEEEAEAIARLATTDPYDLDWERRVWRMEVLTREQVLRHKAWLKSWVNSVETALQDNEFLVGNTFSQADIAVFPRLHMFANIDFVITASEYPNVTRWMHSLEKRQSFIASESDGAKEYSALVRSDMMKKVRAHFQLAEDERDPRLAEAIRDFGNELRKKFGVAELLESRAKTRVLLKPPTQQKATARVRQASQSPRPRKLSLYSWKRSPHALRIEILLRMLDFEFDVVEVDVANDENRAADFLALNPLGEVPVLRADDAVIFDSYAIAEYLGAVATSPALYVPRNSVDIAIHNSWLALETGTHKEFSPLLAEYQFASGARELEPLDENRRQYLRARMLQKLQFVEDALEESIFLGDDKPGYADIAWYSRIEFMVKTNVSSDILSLRNTVRWLDDMRALTGGQSNES